MSIGTQGRRVDPSVTIRPRSEEPLSVPSSAPVDNDKPPLLKRIIWTVLILGVIGAVGTAVALYARSSFETDETRVFYSVKRGDLAISVVERGTLESQENIIVKSEVDDTRGDQIEGASIEWLITNGSKVKQGDLIVELGSASIQEQLDQQILATEAARATFIQAKAKYENQITQNETTYENAALALKLAKLDLRMFTDEDNGTHQLEVETIERAIDDINNEILSAKASLALKKNDKHGIETLFRLGYAAKNELDRARLEFMQAESGYAAKMNKLSTQKSSLKKLQTYEREKQMLTLKGDVETAERMLKQVQLDNQALLDQAKAVLDASDKSFKKEEELQARYEDQIKKCTITAPQDGMVVYAVPDPRRWWYGEIREGGTVRPRQHILSLPNLKKMQVKTSVHESMLDQIKGGLRASIRVEAFPKKVHSGTIKSVAVMANRQSADTKVYETVVTLDGEVTKLKPGMTTVVDIHVDLLEDVLSIPVQGIVQVKDQTWCYVSDGSDVIRRDIELGRTNDKFVEIRGGLVEGDRVVLNPMSILDESEEQDEGDDIRPDDKRPILPDAEKAAPEKAASGKAASGKAASGKAASGKAHGGKPGATGRRKAFDKNTGKATSAGATSAKSGQVSESK